VPSSLEGLSSAAVRRKAEELAAQILEQHWPEGTLPVDPVRIARRMGVEVFSAELGNDVYGVIRGTANGAEIYVDRDQPEKRWRFTAAHELGHYVEHSEREARETSYVDRRSDKNIYDPHEVFANHFAGALLMPTRAAAAVSATGLGDIAAAEHFGVSLQAWRVRTGHLRP
jgi:Zn-dependent peptidase ImmA (M78 family)